MRSATAQLAASVAATAALAGPAAAQVCPPAPQGPGSIPHIRFVDLVACTLDTCPPDLNGDGEVDVFDLLQYLDAWFAGALSADRTGDAMVDVFDLLDYLDAWFAGCP